MRALEKSDLLRDFRLPSVETSTSRREETVVVGLGVNCSPSWPFLLSTLQLTPSTSRPQEKLSKADRKVDIALDSICQEGWEKKHATPPLDTTRRETEDEGLTTKGNKERVKKESDGDWGSKFSV